MATRSVVLPHLHKLPRVIFRRLNTAPSPIATVSTSLNNFHDQENNKSSEPPISTQIITSDQQKILDFEDVKGLFSKVSTTKLLKSCGTLKMSGFEPMIDLGMWVMNSALIRTPILKEVILGSIKRSFYEHFVAGEDLEEVGVTISRLWEAGLRSMLDYGLEHANDNESCDRNMIEFIQTIQSTKSLPPSSASFIVVKITAICPPKLLRRVSDLLRWEYKDSSFHLPWKVKTLPIFCDSSPLYHTPERPEHLTRDEEQDLQLSFERLSKICQQCVESNVPLVIDAEDTTVQPAIDYFTYSSAIMYHKDDDGPIVFGTIQAYLKDARDRLIKTKKASQDLGARVGFKLVRGAYMSSERELADSLGMESPIHNNIDQTHACFNSCAAYMLGEVANGSGAVVLATHNVESGKLAAAKAIDLGIGKENGRLQFAQLYGMSDVLSFGLKNAGFQVSKYLPFGPVEKIMPYLLRRAEENRGLLSTTSLDSVLMRKELMRRSKSLFME